MTERTFQSIDDALMVGGGLVLAGALLWWRLSVPAGLWDPLRGSPMRVNRLGPGHVWVCIAVMLTGSYGGGQVAAWIAPNGLNQEELRNWQGVFAAGFGAVLNTATCLLVAKATFAGGLRGFGIGRRRPGYEAAWAVAGWLVGLFVTGVIFLAVHWILRRFVPHYRPPEHGVFIALQDPALRPWMRVFAMVSAFTIVPIGEELLFRGILQTSVQKLIPARRGSLMHRWVAILAIGALFGAVHSSTPQFIPSLIAFGVLLGFLYERTGSITVPILVHMLFNGKAMVWDYLGRLWLQGH